LAGLTPFNSRSLFCPRAALVLAFEMSCAAGRAFATSRAANHKGFALNAGFESIIAA
jgi:hypothetical protein